MKKTKLTRSLLAACSIVALSAVMYGCAHTDSGPSQEEFGAVKDAAAAAAAEAAAAADAAAAAAAAAAAQADADAAAAAAAAAAADADAKAAADAAAAEAAAAAADAAADAKAAADAAAAAAAEAAAAAAADAKAAADAAAADAAAAAEAQAAAAAAAAAAEAAEAAEAIEAAEAAAAAAAQAQADAEAAAAAAAQAQADAEAEAAAAAQAQADAEAAAEAAAEAQMKAEADAAAAAEAQMKAEADATAARMAQAEAESARDDAIAAREGLEDDAADTQAQSDSDAAKALLGALASVTDEDTGEDGDQNAAGDTLMVPAASKLQVSSDGMLTAKVEDVSGYTMSDMAPDMIEGWRGVMFTNAGGDTLVVYSDIGDDGTATLFDSYTYTRPAPAQGYPGRYAVNTDGTDDTINWDDVTRPDSDVMLAGTVVNPQVTFMGSVDNIPGTFLCAAATCVAPERYSDGTVNGSTTGIGDWFFVPDEGASLYTDDTSFLTFGWWLNKDAGGDPADVRLVSGGSSGLGATRTDTSTEGENLRGSATYSGAAAGKYSMASTTDDTYEGGHFTAMATLEVDFDADSTPGDGANDRNGVDLSGTIDNFMTGDTARDDWSVALMVDDDADDTNDAAPVGSLVADSGDTSRMLTEWSTGGAATGSGTWAATWWDGRTTGTNIDDSADNTVHPMAVNGTFNANIGSAARIQGAFGANIQ